MVTHQVHETSQATPVAFDPEALGAALPPGMSPDSALGRKLIGMYIDDAKRLVDELDGAHDGQDVALQTRTAHTLKSSSATIGAQAMASLAKELETQLRANAAPNVGEFVARLRAEHQRFCADANVVALKSVALVTRNAA